MRLRGMTDEHPTSQLDLFTATAPELLTIAEAAQRVRCCERTIRRAIESGALRAGRVRAGRLSRGAVRIRPADLEAWLFGEEGG
jgi:excisionase family DNA binding protein